MPWEAAAWWWTAAAAAVMAVAVWLLARAWRDVGPPALAVDASDVLYAETAPVRDQYILVPPRRRPRSPSPELLPPSLMSAAAAPGGGRIQCYDPATMQYLGFLPALKPDDVLEHVKRARIAQLEWAGSSFQQRRLLLRVLLKYVTEHQEVVCRVSARDSGKPLVDAEFGEIFTTCEKIAWLLHDGERWLRPERRSPGRMMPHKVARVEYHPLGVVGAIVPWNYPFHNVLNPVLAALFAGNAIVVKVSEHASWSSMFFLRVLKAALNATGAPEDLVHIVTGYGETGAALVNYVDKMIFIGSAAIGRRVMEGAARTLTPVVLELGGKDAFIVVPIALRAAFQCSGQNCIGAERFLVHTSIHDAFVERVAAVVRQMETVRPQDANCFPEFAELLLVSWMITAVISGPAASLESMWVSTDTRETGRDSISQGVPLGGGRCDVGALRLANQAERLQELVDDAVAAGAEVVARGLLPEELGGQFYPPTVLTGVLPSMLLMKEEVFGPIMAVLKVESDEAAVELANDGPFGLGCSVFSRSVSRANVLASKLHVGMASINDFGSTYMSQSLPFGGVKESGFGQFGGVEGLRGCCVARAVAEDRFSFLRTRIPSLLQYPVSERGFAFQEALVRAVYGVTLQAKVRGLLDLVHVVRGPWAGRPPPAQKQR
eukprot:SM000005S17257  [mRNA]  locus=s5:1083720:1088259:- [translate_table: standard]